jgi:filamentous hemagglutinin family protein
MSSEPGLRTFLSQRVAPATSRGGLAADGQRLRLTRISFAVAAAFSSVALGNPLNPTVVVGSATFQSTANTLTVTNTNGAVINWRGFSIGQGEITRFIQPGALSQVLNRVTGGSPSVILGALQSNGRVFLINQNGIAFGPGAQVDVGGLVVSSLGLSNADFAAGRLNFTQQAGAGGIVNQGVIRTASGGLVALVAPNVENHGVIQAPNGDVILAAGKSANLVDLQRPQIQVEVNAADNQALNVGQLVGRNIGIYAGAIRHAGIANANTAALDEQGRVVFKAVGDTLVSGKVEAGNTAGAGGRVEILGNRVGLLDGARVDASGVTGGGTVLVGGDFQGRNPEVQNAQRTYVAPTATVSADALHNGDGGKVVVWADGTTRAYGSLSAHAGTQGGDGGLIETSGKQFLDVEGARIDARAAHGAQGTWLLDPTDITVVAAGANAAYADVDAFADPDVGGAGASRVSPTTLDGAGANVVLQAQNDITVTDAISLTTTPNANLTLQAGRSIAINNSVATNGSGNITMVANNTDNSETNAAGGALVGSGGTNRSTGAASLTVSGAISTGAGGAIKLVNSSASTLGGETGGVTVNSAITTGSSTASGVASGAITIAAGTTITLNPGGSLTTGNATVASTAGVDTAASGAINLTAVTGISGAGTATTGSATVDNAAGGADSAVSGGITLNVSGAGAINLVTAAALAAGGASVSNNTGGTSATTGNLTLSASSINATVAIPEASGATTNTQGVVNATATGAGGGITLSSAGPLRVGVLNTVDGDTAAVAVTVTGGNLLEIANASNLDQDTLTLTADKIKVGAGVTAASVVVKPTGAQSIDLGAGTDTGFALDSTELGNFTVTHLEVGSAAAGAITLSADVTPANTGNLHLRTSGGVDGATGGILGDKNVAITAGGTVNLASATNDIDQLAVSNAGNAVTVVDANGLAVGDVSIIGGTLSGVTGSTVSLTAANGTLTIGNTAAASGKDIDASGAVTLTATTAGSLFEVAAGANVTTTAGGITVNADKIDLAGTLTASAGTQTVTLAPQTGGAAIDLGSAVDTGGRHARTVQRRTRHHHRHHPESGRQRRRRDRHQQRHRRPGDGHQPAPAQRQYRHRHGGRHHRQQEPGDRRRRQRAPDRRQYRTGQRGDRQRLWQ